MEKYDVVFSLGPACRPAYYLQLCGLRNCAYPLDWQMYSIESALHLYETNFSDFFLEYEDLSYTREKRLKGLRYVLDPKNNVISMHHIKDNIPLNKAVDEFRKLMLKRYKRLDNNLNNAKKILIVSNYNEELSVFSNFLLRFSNIYKNKKITLVNIHSDSNYKNRQVHCINDNLCVVEYYFNDVNINGADPNRNKNFWLGNEEEWIKVLENYSLK